MKQQLKYIIKQGLPVDAKIPEGYIDGIVDGILMSFGKVYLVTRWTTVVDDYVVFGSLLELKAEEYIRLQREGSTRKGNIEILELSHD